MTADSKDATSVETYSHGLTREDWIDRCVQRYIDHGGCDLASAQNFATTSWDGDMFRDYKPEDAADEDMSYWEAE
jgi:hypothetical protein